MRFQAVSMLLLFFMESADALVISPHPRTAFVHGVSDLRPGADIFSRQGEGRRCRSDSCKGLVSMRLFPFPEQGFRLVLPALPSGLSTYGQICVLAKECSALLARTAVDWVSDSLTLLAAGMAVMLMGALVMS
jgi:hypothetical protein